MSGAASKRRVSFMPQLVHHDRSEHMAQQVQRRSQSRVEANMVMQVT